jgi:predicted SAM-dependent methyltransferase
MNPDMVKQLRDRADRFLCGQTPPYKLDLACGNNKRKGFIGIDRMPINGVDIIWDLEEYPWPFVDNSVGEVYCAHFVEHVDDLIKFMNEMYRVCKNGATIHIVAPYYTSVGASQDPTHKRFISEQSFLYFDANWRKQTGLTQYPILSDIRGKAIQYAWDKRLADAPNEEKEFAKAHYWNVIAEIGMVMTVVKMG